MRGRMHPGIAVLALVGCRAGCEPGLAPCPESTRSGCPDPLDETFVDPLEHVGRAEGDTFIEILDVVAAYPVIYACTGTQGLTVWRATDDGAPDLLAQGIGPASAADPRFPRCQHIALDGDRLVLTNRGDEVQPQPFLWLYDVSDPGDPEELRGWRDDASIEGASLAGNRIYAAAHTAGVLFLEDAGGPTLTELGSFADADSDAWQPLLADDVLVVAEGATGLRTYDVSGDAPQLLATVALDGSSRDLVMVGGIAHVATSVGLAAVDLADPADPVVLAETTTAGTSLGIARGVGDTVLLAEWDAVRGYDVSDPASPVPVLSEIVPSDDDFSRVLALDVARDQSRVYAGEWRGLHAYVQREDGVGPDIWASPQALQFGVVGSGGSQDQVLVVRNQGNRALTVRDVVSTDQVSADATCFQVDPGSSKAVEVEFNPSSDAEVNTAVKICSDDPDEPELLVGVSGNVFGLGVGDPMPSFSLRALDGTSWSDEAVAGNITVLAYFATF